MTVRVLLAEDHALLRAGVRMLLSTMREIEVVGETSSGLEVLSLVASQQPNVVLMDIVMPGMSGLDVISRLASEHPKVRVLVLSMYAHEEYVLEALRAGASGYLLKDADAEELERAVLAVSRGEAFFSPAVSRQVLDDYVRRTGGTTPQAPLTPRQREILRRIAEGSSTREIAQSLGLSVKTVETHRAQIMSRLDIHDVAGLVRYAIRVGLVSVDR